MKFPIILIILLVFLIFPFPVRAVTLTVSNIPASISSDPFSIDIYVEGPNPGTNYLRLDLYKDGTSNYFGETYNGSSWYSGSDGTQYFPITISLEGTASAQLQARLGSPSITEYPGPGNYKFKIRRYTSQSSYSFSNFYDIQITYSTPTPTPTQAPTSAPTSTPSPTPTPTPTKSPTPTPLKTKTPTPTALQTTSGQATSEETATPESLVLGLGQEASSPTAIATAEARSKFPLLSVVFILVGLTCLVGAGFLIFKMRKEGYNSNNGKIPENS